jgi:hypothetical protein
MNLNEHIKRMKTLFNAEHGIVKPLVSEQVAKYERLPTFKTFSEYCTSTITPRETAEYVEELKNMGFKCVGSVQMLEPNYPSSDPEKQARTITLMKPMPLDGGTLYIDLHEVKFIHPVSTFGYYVEYASGRGEEGNVEGTEGVKDLEERLDAEFRK